MDFFSEDLWKPIVRERDLRLVDIFCEMVRRFVARKVVEWIVPLPGLVVDFEIVSSWE